MVERIVPCDLTSDELFRRNGVYVSAEDYDATQRRIAELEAALRPFANAVYNDNGDVTIEHPGHGDYMRAKRVLAKK